jgi:UDP-sulfoquinovose synthase
MRILILGGDGYLGWPTALRFSNLGHDVHLLDNYLRRRAHEQAGTDSLTPIDADLLSRVATWRALTGREIGVTEGDLCDWEVVESVVRGFRPRRSSTTARCPAPPTR